MSAPIYSAPIKIVADAEKELMATEEEEIALKDLLRAPVVRTPSGNPLPPCQKMVRIGLFFDGTNNNMDRDQPQNGHTNIVRLFEVHKHNEGQDYLKDSSCFRFYIPGVGTRFPENQEWSETKDGKSMGKGGQARILFGILQVYNAVHRAFNENRALYSDDQITAKLKSYTRDVEQNYDKEYPEHVRRQKWFTQLRDELNDKLQAQRDIIIQPRIPMIRVAVFGFSRGAIEARSFCYWLHAALEEKNTLAGMPIQINFLGLFDSVASIGIADSASKTTLLKFADGHFSWAAETLTALPSLVKKTVHYIAAHEQRMNFPITRVKGGNVHEVLYPGVHSDVGGGYCPKEQGRGITVGQMVSQVPLLHMHKIARLAGVPLVTYRQMPSDLQADFALSPELAANWNAYMAAWLRAGTPEEAATDGQKSVEPSANDKSGEDPATNNFGGTYDQHIQKHMSLYYRFRSRWLGRMAHLPACQRATPQEQQDMVSYDDLFKGDMQLLAERAKGGRPRQRDVYGDDIKLYGPGNEQIANQTQLQRADARAHPDTWEALALQVFEEQKGQSSSNGIALLEEQVHDSLAGFYLAGYISTNEKAEKIREWQTKPPSKNDRYHYQAWQNFQQAKEANPKLQDVLDEKAELARQAENARFNGRIGEMEAIQRRIAFTDDEATLLTQDAKGNPIFPVQKDSDAKELRSGVITTQTGTLREGGGYLVPRHVFLP